MIIFVNSKEQDVAGESTVLALLEQLKLIEKRVAVEVNAELVTKAEWPARILQPNDRVEIVSFVGGG